MKVVAGALGAPRGTAVAILAHHGIPAAALSADQQFAQQELAPADPVEDVARFVLAHLDPGFPLARLHLLPEVVTDNAKLRYLDDLARFLFVDPGHFLAGAWVLHIGGAVPFQSANVEGVVEEARAPVDLASDGRISPLPAACAGNLFVVQTLGDRARAGAGGVFLEDPAEDYSFGLIDEPAPAAGGVAFAHHVVA